MLVQFINMATKLTNLDISDQKHSSRAVDLRVQAATSDNPNGFISVSNHKTGEIIQRIGTKRTKGVKI